MCWGPVPGESGMLTEERRRVPRPVRFSFLLPSVGSGLLPAADHAFLCSPDQRREHIVTVCPFALALKSKCWDRLSTQLLPDHPVLGPT